MDVVLRSGFRSSRVLFDTLVENGLYEYAYHKIVDAVIVVVLGIIARRVCWCLNGFAWIEAY